ncbi:MAG: iron ABC transporter permease, partial [Firmicutes bacterium]|nr:iron ABC transporter permease [Bacillota bacterium]
MGKSTVILKRLSKVFNREEPQMSVILACLLILALISIILAVGLGPVSVAPAAVA